MPPPVSPWFERFISAAMLVFWLLAGAAFACAWYAITDAWPPIWARLVGGLILFALVMPLEAALARRHMRRANSVTRHRKTAA